MVTQIIDNVSFHLKEAHDFSFLSKYGRLFCVFDQNDSGNISFGVKNGNMKYFIKVAGAKTAESDRDTQESAEVLQNAMILYETLKHPSLIELVEHYQYEDLYIAVFKWAEGDCLYDHWNFEKYAQNPQLQSPAQKFKCLPIDKRIKAVRTIFDFLLHVENKGFVAVDFYDGSIMYDFVLDTTTICDIDFFRLKPTYNDMGEGFWGTKRLKAPEEYSYGAVIDETTNVFTLGALIFYIFGSYSKEDINQIYINNSFFPCILEKWELNEALYDLARKAVNLDRHKRHNSISKFFDEWDKAIYEWDKAKGSKP